MDITRNGDNPVFEAVWQVVTRRTYDRAMACTDLAERLLHREGDLRRDEERLYAGDRELNRDRELLPKLAQATGLGLCLYLGNRRIATATVLDAGTAPELGGNAAASLVDTVLRRKEIFKGNLEYTGRRYLVVGRPLYAGEGTDFAPIGMVEAFQDEQAFFDLLSAAARSGLDDQVADVQERADTVEGLISFIDDVARRLQLLALNGNIIAAQAGEHGRAFRVVCRELGSLADQAKLAGGEVRKLMTVMGLEEYALSAVDPMSVGDALDAMDSLGEQPSQAGESGDVIT